MEIFLSILFFLILLILGYWWLQASSWKVPTAVTILLALDVIVIIGFLIVRPFIFGDVDANNIILYGIYLITAGALFFIPVTAHQEQILKGKMPSVVKQILVSYLIFSAIILIFITVEAFRIRS